MENIFSAVTGATIMEDERNLLIRLPGLGAAQDNALNRSFIDSDFMNVCCSSTVHKYIQDPYTDYSKYYSFENIIDPMSDVGLEALAATISKYSTQFGVVTASINRALDSGFSQMAFDIFRASQKIRSSTENVQFDGIAVGEIDLSGSDYDECKVHFSGCIIDRIILPSADDNNLGITFSSCLIGGIEGRISLEDLNAKQFRDCEVGEFTDEYSVNSQILDSSLPLGVRVLIVTLRKLFTQGGSSRLESALFRGLDQRSKMVVPEVISLLSRHGFIVETGRKGKITYAGTKGKRSEALSIIRSPNAANIRLVKDCAALFLV